jgi:hypothetical protein
LYLCILSTDVIFKHFKYQLKQFENIKLNLSDFFELKKSKKIIYKFEENTKENNENRSKTYGTKLQELKQLKNDFNIKNLEVSNEHFQFLISILTEATEQLPQSLKKSNDFNIALI